MHPTPALPTGALVCVTLASLCPSGSQCPHVWYVGRCYEPQESGYLGSFYWAQAAGGPDEMDPHVGTRVSETGAWRDRDAATKGSAPWALASGEPLLFPVV